MGSDLVIMDLDVRNFIDFTKIGITVVITVLAVWKALRR